MPSTKVTGGANGCSSPPTSQRSSSISSSFRASPGSMATSAAGGRAKPACARISSNSSGASRKPAAAAQWLRIHATKPE
eukprot:10132167-Alexandrium_andersonii.AAC.1